jgi:hypothetical protein
MPEPDPNQNPTGQTTPAPAWWSRLHSSTQPEHPDHSASQTEPNTTTGADTGPDSPTDNGPAIWPEGWSVIPPVGSIATDVGVTFSLAPESLTDRPLLVRCTSCDWDATAPHRQAVDLVRVHALRHIANPHPRIEHLPSWLPWLKGHRQ